MILEGGKKLSDEVKQFLKKHVQDVTEPIGVSDGKIQNFVQKLGLKCVTNRGVSELLRGAKIHLPAFLAGGTPASIPFVCGRLGWRSHVFVRVYRCVHVE